VVRLAEELVAGLVIEAVDATKVGLAKLGLSVEFLFGLSLIC
jgi:hypothetical protein